MTDPLVDILYWPSACLRTLLSMSDAVDLITGIVPPYVFYHIFKTLSGSTFAYRFGAGYIAAGLVSFASPYAAMPLKHAIKRGKNAVAPHDYSAIRRGIAHGPFGSDNTGYYGKAYHDYEVPNRLHEPVSNKGKTQ